jgi:putative hydrolase of HD superfamily
MKPESGEMPERFEQQLRFILEIDKLKSVMRRTYLINSDRRENSAEHSWHLALMAIVLAEHANEPIDLSKVIKMVLVHDIVEIDAGDTYLYDDDRARSKYERECAAANRIFGILPEEQAREMEKIWREFEAGLTPEARFATALDRFAPQFHNYYTHGKSWRENAVTADRILDRNAGVADGSIRLWQFAQELVADAVDRGFLPRKGPE